MRDDSPKQDQIFDEIVQIVDPIQREQKLNELCGNDEQLRDAILDLVNRDQQMGSFLEVPPTAIRPDDSDTTPGGEPAPAPAITNYRLLNVIGQGGMGTVWLAEQEKPVRRQVALKLIRTDTGARQIISRFEAERQALALMDHPNISKVLGAGTTDSGHPYFVMELVRGVPLNRYCDENQLDIRQRLELFVQVCKAVAHAHQKGIIHRDLKPSNVLVEKADGQPVTKVIDFGLAKAIGPEQRLTDESLHTEFGRVIGTLQYMSPEQADTGSKDIDTRTDIYSLGVILFELLTGSTPLKRELVREMNLLQVLEQLRSAEPVRPSVRVDSSGNMISEITTQRQISASRLQQILRGELDWIVMKALETNRDLRYETASAFSDDIYRYLNHEPVTARGPSTRYRIQKFVRRNFAAVTVAAILLVSAVLLFSTLAVSLAAVATKNRELTAANTRADDNARNATERLNLALQATQAFYTGIAQDAILKKPESREFRQKFLTSALQLYKQLDDEMVKDVVGKEKVVKALVNLSIISFDAGSVESSRAALKESIKICEQLLQVDPNEPSFQFALASTCQNLGVIEFQAGKNSHAESYWQRSLQIYQTLAKQYPGDPKYQHRQAWIYMVMGMLNERVNKPEQARISYEESVERYRQLVELEVPFPNLKSHLSNSLANLGTWYFSHGETERSLGLLHESLDIDRGLVAKYSDDPNYSYGQLGNYQFNLTGKLDNVALALSQTGQFDQSAALYREAIEILSSMTEKFPNAVPYRERYGLILNNFCSVLRKSGNSDEEAELLAKSIEIHTQLVKDVPDNIAFQTRLAGGYSNLATLRALQGDWKEAEAKSRQATILLGDLHKDHASDSDVILYYAQAKKNLAEIHLKQEKWSAAESQFADSIELLSDLVEGDPNLEHAKTLIREGALGRAKALEELDRSEEAAQARSMATNHDCP